MDPRSVSIESLQLKAEKDTTALKSKTVESGAKCIFPKDVQVAEIKKKEGESQLYTMCQPRHKLIKPDKVVCWSVDPLPSGTVTLC